MLCMAIEGRHKMQKGVEIQSRFKEQHPYFYKKLEGLGFKQIIWILYDSFEGHFFVFVFIWYSGFEVVGGTCKLFICVLRLDVLCSSH